MRGSSRCFLRFSAALEASGTPAAFPPSTLATPLVSPDGLERMLHDGPWILVPAVAGFVRRMIRARALTPAAGRIEPLHSSWYRWRAWRITMRYAARDSSYLGRA